MANRHSLYDHHGRYAQNQPVRASWSVREESIVGEGSAVVTSLASLVLPLRLSRLKDAVIPCESTTQWNLRPCSPFARLTGFQNLIPLVIRPLRLVLPSERLRSVRIVLLKATHLPFVSAIWAFEQLTDTQNRNAQVASFSGPQTPTLPKKAVRLPVNSPRLLMAEAPSTLGRRPHKPQAPAGFTETDAQLKTLVLKLSTQVEELTTMVSQLQEQREASTSAA
jgi:hypothetical protein